MIDNPKYAQIEELLLVMKENFGFDQDLESQNGQTITKIMPLDVQDQNMITGIMLEKNSNPASDKQETLDKMDRLNKVNENTDFYPTQVVDK